MPLLIPKEVGLLYDTLLEAIGIVLEAYFKFEFTNGSEIALYRLGAISSHLSTWISRVGRRPVRAWGQRGPILWSMGHIVVSATRMSSTGADSVVAAASSFRCVP